MRILALAAVAVALTGCAGGTNPVWSSLDWIDANLGPPASASTSFHPMPYPHQSSAYDDDRDERQAEPARREPPAPPVIFKGPTHCHPGIRPENLVCD